MGNERVTLQGLQVMEVTELGVRVKGLVPGATGARLEVRKRHEFNQKIWQLKKRHNKTSKKIIEHHSSV